MRKIILLTLTCNLVIIQGFCQSNQQIENILTFTRLYGYIKYFHPSDEAASVDWNRFAIYGAKQVESCKNAKELQSTLTTLFQPIAPTVKIYTGTEPYKFNQKLLLPANNAGYDVVSWQHQGIGLISMDGAYKSKRTNRPISDLNAAKTIEPSSTLFSQYAQVGEYSDKEIGGGLRAIIPLALYGTKEQTFPAADKTKLNQLQRELLAIPIDEVTAQDLHVKLGDLAIIWNIFQHFYPYFDVVKTDWQEALKNAMKSAYTEQTEADFQKTLQKLTARLKDGHVRVSAPFVPNYYYPPISWEWVENQLVITNVLEKFLLIDIGDVVTAINGQSPEKYFNEVHQHISAATKGWLDYRAKTEALSGGPGSTLHLKIKKSDGTGTEITLKKNMLPSQYLTSLPKEDTIKQLADGLMYINVGKAPAKAIRKVMPQLQEIKAIICDLRGYPKGDPTFIEYLLTQKDTSSQWMQTPHIIYPDQEKIVGYRKSKWGLKPRSPHLNAKIIFIIDGQAISYAESYMSFIEYYKLATIVGQPTAGTNGNVNPFTLPGKYRISWTGMKVLKHDGSQHHGVGILPNVYVEKTIKGVRENRDEFLEKPLEIAKCN